ncbi:MAG: hypothetical protein AB8F34_12830 [Akkermansiaceae bacterium]
MNHSKYIAQLSALAGFAITVTTSQAAITYIDAQEGLSGNTFSTTQGALAADNSSWLSVGTSNGSSQWGNRI